MAQVWFTSDQHIGHKLVAGLRGFALDDQVVHRPGGEAVPLNPDVEAHDAHLAAVWDSQVHPDDVVYVLGDISINGGQQHALDWFSERPGTKHLISGNHDPVHPMHRTSANRLRSEAWTSVFATIQPFGRRKAEGRAYLMSHFPYASWGDGSARSGSRFEEYRLPDTGLPLLHGHTHGKEKAHGKMYHVGWDAHGELVSLVKITEWLRNWVYA